MNSKERVRAALAGEQVDKIPLGFYVVDYDTIERVIGHETYVRNKIGIQVALWEGRRDEVAQSLKEDTVAFCRKIDCADLLLPKEAQLLPPKDYAPDPPRRIGKDRWRDREGRVYQAVPEVNDIQCIHDPVLLARTFTLADFLGAIEPSAPDPSVFEVFDHVFRELGHERYVAGPTGGVTALTLPGGTERGL